MKLRLILSMVLVLLIQTAANAQGFGQTLGSDEPLIKDQAYYSAIYKLATEPTDIRTAQAGNKLDFSTTSVRGGSNSGKALGMYQVGDGVVYRSDYAKLDPKVWAQWTCALHDYITANGGGFDNYLRYRQTGTQPGPLDILTPQQSKSQDPWDRSFVPYTKQEEFAKTWWAHYNPEFRKMGFVWKDWWINDAILDGNMLIGREIIRNRGSSDAVMYADSTLAKLVKKE